MSEMSSRSLNKDPKTGFFDQDPFGPLGSGEGQCATAPGIGALRKGLLMDLSTKTVVVNFGQKSRRS